ncbi:MAG: hypothetical protein AB7D06_17270 [Pedobacter sp.]
MKIIAERIVDGETAEQIGIDKNSYGSRRETIDRYLATTSGLFDREGYLEWLRSDPAGSVGASRIVKARQGEVRHATRRRTGSGCGCGRSMPPGLVQRVGSLMTTLGRWAVAGFSCMPKKAYHERLKICAACEEYTWAKTCSVCGCFMPAKAKLASIDCPKLKWHGPPTEATIAEV